MMDIVERLRQNIRSEDCLYDMDPDLLQKAADEIERLREELAEHDAVLNKMAELLDGVAIALRGPEPPLTKWDWSDLPDRVQRLRHTIERDELLMLDALDAMEGASKIMDSNAQERQDAAVAALRERLGD